MEYLLFVAYLVFFAWLVTRLRFFTNSGLSRPQLIIIFLLKVMAGIFYGWIGLYYGGLAKMSDTWGFHTNSIIEYNLLQTDPREYLTNLFYNPYGGGFEKFFNADESYWNDLKANAFIKILSIFNIFSFGHYYVNVVFYSFLSLFGPIAIYRVMSDVFPTKKIAVMLATFLVPSFLYWTSGIHKDGLIFLGISLVVYHFYFGWKEGKYGIKRISGILLGLLLLLVLRNFIIVVILPALLAWGIANRWPKRGLAVFASLYLIFAILFFTIRYVKPEFDFPKAVVTKQQEFLKLQGNTSIPIEELQPTVGSFMRNIPVAFTLSTIRPYPGDVRHILSLAAATEINLLLLMFAAFLFLYKNGIQSPNFIYFCVFFSFTLLLAIGFSVNNLGAIVRYRSVIIPLLIVPMAAQIDWSRLNSFLFNGIKNKNNV
ncbi:MAG TPA: hypothetical protein VFX58_17495 [Chitinophagaceae bacterium]|nr:hypothetical protein [Chitinophagaceae bacterium]